MSSFDVAIFGGGIFGLASAWECTRNGASVAIYDPNRFGSGASGGILGALAPHAPDNWNPKKQFQLESLKMAEAWWAEIDEVSGISSGYERSGRIQPLQSVKQLEMANLRTAAAKENWSDAYDWTVFSAESDLPIKSPVGHYIFDNLSAKLNPQNAISSLVLALEKRNCTFCKDPSIKAQSYLHATGYRGLTTLSEFFSKEIGNGVKGQAALFEVVHKMRSQVFFDGIHFVPHGECALTVGATSEREFENENECDELLTDLVKKASVYFPDLESGRVSQKWAAVRPRAISRSPIIGAWPGREGHFILNGAFKIGLGIAPRAANSVAELMLNQRQTYPLEFSVSNLLKMGA